VVRGRDPTFERPSDVRGDALGELLHDLDLSVVFEERQVATCHELDRDRHLVPDVEERLHELIGRAGVRGPARQELLGVTLERGRGGRRE
jgi:hypothetical protein